MGRRSTSVGSMESCSEAMRPTRDVPLLYRANAAAQPQITGPIGHLSGAVRLVDDKATQAPAQLNGEPRALRRNALRFEVLGSRHEQAHTRRVEDAAREGVLSQPSHLLFRHAPRRALCLALRRRRCAALCARRRSGGWRRRCSAALPKVAIAAVDAAAALPQAVAAELVSRIAAARTSLSAARSTGSKPARQAGHAHPAPCEALTGPLEALGMRRPIPALLLSPTRVVATGDCSRGESKR